MIVKCAARWWRVGWNQVHAGAGTTVLRNESNMGYETLRAMVRGSEGARLPVKDGDRVICEGQTMPASLNTRVDQTIKFSLS